MEIVDSTLTVVTDGHVSGVLSALDRQVVAAVPPGGNWRDLPEEFPSARVRQIRESAARGEGSRSTYYGRLSWDRPAHTVSTYFTRPGNGCFIHPEANRLLTVREAARLQSFPDSFHFTGSMRQQAMQIGNAVPPLLALRLGRMFRPGTAVDLFAGAGGLSLGLKLAGHEVAAAVDHNQDAVATYNRNLGDHAIAADLSDDESRRQSWADISERAGGHVDLIAGGPPCQGFSTAGKALADDPRNKLVWSFLDGVRALKPEFVLMENVMALAQKRGGSYLERLRSELRELGYRSKVAAFHAESYSVAQTRRRVILLASRTELPEWPTPTRDVVAPYFTSLMPYPPQGDSAPFTVRDAIGNLPLDESQSLESNVSVGATFSVLQEWLAGDRSVEREL